MTILPVDIEGLNLILGGGVPLIQRAEDLDESATLLIRGTPGSGKTIFGTQLAGSIARSLKCDVAYGCVELLPTELAAQHTGLGRDVPERVVVSPFAMQETQSDECRIFAGLLDIGDQGEEQARLEPAVLGLLAAIENAGGRPRVLVIDSLSDGYRLGSSAPRELADALCKLAVQRGMVLILLEEIVESRPSAWSFATDVVIELGIGQGPQGLGPLETLHRRLTVSKNRFGPSEPGPHRFMVARNHGVQTYPSLSSYLRPWALEALLPNWKPPLPETWDWGTIVQWDARNSNNPALKLPIFAECTLLLRGFNTRMLISTAYLTGIRNSSLNHSTDILLNLGMELPSPRHMAEDGTALEVVHLGNPMIDSDLFLSQALNAITRIRANGRVPGRLLIGDMKELNARLNGRDITYAIEVLLVVMRRTGLPVILFETIGQIDPTRYASLVDIMIYVRATSPQDHSNRPVVTWVRTGESAVSQNFSPDLALAAPLLKYF